MYPIEHHLKDLGKKNIVLQDNTSTIRLVKGGRRVYGSRTRSILIMYFYAHENETVDDGTIIVVEILAVPQLRAIENKATKRKPGNLPVTPLTNIERLYKSRIRLPAAAAAMVRLVNSKSNGVYTKNLKAPDKNKNKKIGNNVGFNGDNSSEMREL